MGVENGRRRILNKFAKNLASLGHFAVDKLVFDKGAAWNTAELKKEKKNTKEEIIGVGVTLDRASPLSKKMANSCLNSIRSQRG